jgi:2-deoxy-D-gluconate 3-dehydrogenase
MILDQFNLRDRIALVTGANRGLGQAMAIGLAEAGADIACVSKSGEDRTTRQRIEELGRRFLSLKANLAEPAQRVGLVDKVVAHFGQIDILVNNAGSGTRHEPDVFPMDEWRETLEVHLNAAFDLAQQAAQHMLPRGKGRIINIGSIMCEEAGLNICAYTAAKHGIAGLTKSLAVSWASKGIQVNCIAPGYFETNINTSLKNHPVRGPQILQRIPLGRWGQPHELAGLCVFLASDACPYLHGSVVVADGGWLAR